MAITKIWGIKKTVGNAIKYITNEQKTDGQLLVTSHNCDAHLADLEFAMIRQSFNKDNGNLAFHLVQSFDINEVTEEVAHGIGKELLDKLGLENHKAVIATHIDKGHIHNHIIFNSVSDDGVRYYDNKKSYYKVRQVNDQICKEFGLSVIKNESYTKGERTVKNKERRVKAWEKEPKSITQRSILKRDIDEAIKKSNSYDEFINCMKKEKQYEIKHGKYLSFKPQGKERFVRDRSLGEEYTLERILNRIELSKYNFTINSFSDKKKKVYNSKVYKKSRLHVPHHTALYKFIRKSILIYNTVFKHKKKSTVKSYESNFKNDVKVKNENIQKLSKQLLIIKDNHINNLSDIKNKKTELVSQIKDINVVISELKKNDSTLKDIYNQVYSYKKFLPVYQSMQNKLFKKSYENKNKYELKLFYNAKSVLIKYGIDSDEKIIAFLDQYKEHIKKTNDLLDKKQLIRKRLLSFSEIEKTVITLKRDKDELKHSVSKEFER